MNVSDTLNKAADLIEERGWESGEGWVTDESAADAPLCLEGGIMAALGLRIQEGLHDDRQFVPLVSCPAYRAVVSYLGRAEVFANERGFEGEPLYWWNDEAARSAEDVVEVLRATALIEAAREVAVELVSA